MTPSDIAPARLSQQQIDELQQQYQDRRYFAADPSAAGAALSRQHRAGQRRCVCGAAGYHIERCRSTRTGCATPCTRWSTGIRTWRPGSANSSTSRCRSSRPIPCRRGGMSSWTPATSSRRAGPAGVRRRTCRGLRSRWPAGFSGGVDPHRSRPAPVCADQSPHRAGWLVAADPAARNIRQLSRAAAARGRAVSQVCHLAGRSRP